MNIPEAYTARSAMIKSIDTEIGHFSVNDEQNKGTKKAKVLIGHSFTTWRNMPSLKAQIRSIVRKVLDRVSSSER